MFIRKHFSRFLGMAAIAVVLLAGAITPQHAGAQAFSDYAENKLVDLLLRQQTLTPPASVFVGLGVSACSDSSVGTEVTGGNYARVEVASGLTAWAGTQGAGTTTASTGTGGQTSNNAAITFPTPSASWGTITHLFLIDASTGGNMLFCMPLTASKTINSGDTISFAPGALTLTLN